jgi:hypothetical protein
MIFTILFLIILILFLILPLFFYKKIEDDIGPDEGGSKATLLGREDA